jgi:transcriptional antiterminator RfaH
MSKSWAIIQFKPNAHKLAKRNLNHKGFKTFLPFEEITIHKKGKLLPAQRPLFPGYMFVTFERENVPWHKINYTYGVSKLLTINNAPCIVPNTLINGIMAQCNKANVLIPQKQFYKDDRVCILNGPFENFVATVESIDKNKRIWVLIDLMGLATRTSVDTKILKYAT